MVSGLGNMAYEDLTGPRSRRSVLSRRLAYSVSSTRFSNCSLASSGLRLSHGHPCIARLAGNIPTMAVGSSWRSRAVSPPSASPTRGFQRLRYARCPTSPRNAPTRPTRGVESSPYSDAPMQLIHTLLMPMRHETVARSRLLFGCRPARFQQPGRPVSAAIRGMRGCEMAGAGARTPSCNCWRPRADGKWRQLPQREVCPSAAAARNAQRTRNAQRRGANSVRRVSWSSGHRCGRRLRSVTPARSG